MNFDPTGYTWVHEHLHIDLSGFKNNLDCRLDQYDLICQEMKDLRVLGVSNIIEMTNRYMGRNPQFMLDLMRDTGINVVSPRRGHTSKPDAPSQPIPLLARWEWNNWCCYRRTASTFPA